MRFFQNEPLCTVWQKTKFIREKTATGCNEIIAVRKQTKQKILIHSGQKCLLWVTCLSSKMPMFQRAGMKEGELPLSPNFHYLMTALRVPRRFARLAEL
jgi:hypothetical protein